MASEVIMMIMGFFKLPEERGLVRQTRKEKKRKCICSQIHGLEKVYIEKESVVIGELNVFRGQPRREKNRLRCKNYV